MERPTKLDLLPDLRSHSLTAASTEECKFDDVKALQEEPITVTFVLPDDSTVSQQFKKGHTVAVLKAFLSEEFDFRLDTTELLLNDQIMLDPFSLTDFASVTEASAIEVCVQQRVDRSNN